jgi:hypothetical protein
MKVIGKFITTDSDFDEQPIWLIEVQNLSFELQRKIIEAVDCKIEFIEIKEQDWKELIECNSFNVRQFPCVINGYLDFVV